MASRDNQEKKAFERAKQIREILINQLSKCNSVSELERIQKNYDENKAKGRFATTTLTTYHSAVIQSLNFQITHLFIAKSEQFAPATVVGAVDTHTNTGTLGVVVDKVEHNSPVASPVQQDTKQTDVSDTTLVEDAHLTEPGTVSTIGKHEAVNPLITNNAVVPCHGENHDDSVIPDLNKEKYLVAVRAQIEVLKGKVNHFYSRYEQCTKAGDYKGYQKYFAAHQAASDVVNQIEELTNKYSNNTISLSSFKSQAKELFDEKNKNIQQLQTHRGWKEILVNVLAAIIGNVFFLAAAACAGSFILFKPATDSANKVNALASVVNKVEEDEEDEENLDLATICKC